MVKLKFFDVGDGVLLAVCGSEECEAAENVAVGPGHGLGGRFIEDEVQGGEGTATIALTKHVGHCVPKVEAHDFHLGACVDGKRGHCVRGGKMMRRRHDE